MVNRKKKTMTQLGKQPPQYRFSLNASDMAMGISHLLCHRDTPRITVAFCRIIPQGKYHTAALAAPWLYDVLA